MHWFSVKRNWMPFAELQAPNSMTAIIVELEGKTSALTCHRLGGSQPCNRWVSGRTQRKTQFGEVPPVQPCAILGAQELSPTVSTAMLFHGCHQISVRQYQAQQAESLTPVLPAPVLVCHGV
mmetsp:Transcript_113133/g.314961  ORF Transcript_113133/g.314961 Transcript_113133/m.314961 type:complete len:122 (+) Transcript_113133:321-686(+)